MNQYVLLGTLIFVSIVQIVSIIYVLRIRRTLKEMRQKEVPPADFISTLMQQWDFLVKVITNHVQKAAISKYIAEKFIKDKDVVILDSGSTVYLVPKYLIDREVELYTNNIFASVSVAGISKMKVRIYQLPGFLDYNYAATYPPMGAQSALALVPTLHNPKIILAATSLSFDNGLCVGSADDKNRKFKQSLLWHQTASKIIIAVDWTKFRPPQVGREIGVLQEGEWKHLINDKKNIITVVTNHPPSNMDKTSFILEIEKFAKNNIQIAYAD